MNNRQITLCMECDWNAAMRTDGTCPGGGATPPPLNVDRVILERDRLREFVALVSDDACSSIPCPGAHLHGECFGCRARALLAELEGEA